MEGATNRKEPGNARAKSVEPRGDLDGGSVPEHESGLAEGKVLVKEREKNPVIVDPSI